MNNTALIQRMGNILSDLLGLGLDDLIGPDERIQHVTATAAIGIAFGALFSVFNILTENMLVLGLIEGAAVLAFMVPAWWLARRRMLIGVAENLILLSSFLIYFSLIVFGGIAGTGLFWICTFPFLVFFLKGQKHGWRYSLAFLGLVAAYFIWALPLLPFAYQYPPVYATHFILALAFYMLIASAFNLLRTRFEEQLQARVVEKTAAAKEYLNQLQYLATHDVLTGLPNRVRLLEILDKLTVETAHNGQGLLICNIRLERLFELGNVLGVAGADNLVRQVAEHLATITDNNGILARTRRDEFIIVYHLDEPTVSPEYLQRFIVEHQFSVQEQGYTLHVELTLGLSIFPNHASEPQLLLKKAEQAMLQARSNGLQWTIYDAGQELVFVHHHLLFGKLREAIPRGDLQVFYQPQIDLASGRIIGAEALSRWNDPEEGQISPVVFVPVAEESGLIRPMTAWLARESMSECARWHSLGFELDISINISAVSLLDPELLDALIDAAKTAGLPPHRVNIELTESCFMASLDRALEIMRRMRDAGFRLSIDDFGTGFSSLSYLKYLPINELKIDQSFVLKLLESESDQAIVASTIELAHNFGLAVVAEGIEDDATAEWLKARQCDIGQGFGFARPMPADDFVEFAQRNLSQSGLVDENHSCQ